MAQQNQPHRNKKWLYLITVSVLIALCAGTEIWLRAAGKFAPQPLFIDAPNKQGYLQPNPNIMQRFFAKPEMTPKISPEIHYFSAEKPPDSFRIVVQGGSTAAGFPYGRWGSLARMLQQRFKRIYPEKNIEIINTAIALANSAVLLDFNREIQSIQPDLVIIYAGHHEFFSAMPVDANVMPFNVNNLRLYGFVTSLYDQYVVSESTTIVPVVNASQSSTEHSTSISNIARKKLIPFNSESYKRSVAQFSHNLALLLQAYQHAGIPVMIGNLVSNESDQVPFSGVPQFNTAQLQRWLLQPQLQKQQLATALQNDNSQRDPALIQYLIGQLAASSGDFNKAREHFRRARDLDKLRLRAPMEFNQIIADIAAKHAAILVDVDARMRKDTRNGLIGAQHMWTHLHPTERGYFVLADAFLQGFEQQNYITDVMKYPDNHQLAWSERPISKVDLLYAKYKVDQLTGSYPFTTRPTTAEIPKGDPIETNAVLARINGAPWIELNHRLVPQYHQAQDFQQDALLSGLLADALPDNPSWAYIAGFKYKKLNNLPLALHYLHRDSMAHPNNYAGRLSLAETYFLLNRHNDSLQHLLFIKENKPDHPNIDQLIEIVSAKKQ